MRRSKVGSGEKGSVSGSTAQHEDLETRVHKGKHIPGTEKFVVWPEFRMQGERLPQVKT